MDMYTKEPREMSASAVPPGGRAAAGAREIRIVAFPKEFQKDFWKSLDKRILSIFFINLVLIYGFFLYVALQPKREQLSVDTRLLKKLGKALNVDPKLLEELDVKKEEEKEDESSSATSTAVVKPGSQRDKVTKAEQAKEAAKARQAAAQKAAATKGVFAVAGALGGKGGGKFAGGDFRGTSTGLDNVLTRIGGIGDATGAEGERTIVGDPGSIKGGAGIGELTAELAGSGGVSVFAGQEGSGLVGVGKASLSGGGGGASAADFQSTIDQGSGAVQACYTKELKKSPDLKGKLSVSIKVNPQGKVGGVTITANTIGSAVANCVTNKIRGWVFPRGKKGMVTVNQTFVFTR